MSIEEKFNSRSFFAKSNNGQRIFQYSNLKSDNTCQLSITTLSGVLVTGYKVNLLSEALDKKIIFKRKAPPKKIIAISSDEQKIYFYEKKGENEYIKYEFYKNNLQLLFFSYCDFEGEKDKYKLKLFEFPEENKYYKTYYSK